MRISRVQLFATAWTVAYQDPLSMGFSRQEYWSGLPFPSPMRIREESKITLKRWALTVSRMELLSAGMRKILEGSGMGWTLRSSVLNAH